MNQEEQDIRRELGRIVKAQYAKWSQTGDYYESDPALELSENRRLNARLRKLEKERQVREKQEAATHPVKFVIWKRYGFRHIAGGSWTLCGSHLYGYKYSEFPDWGMDRPLCGTCRKSWKKLTGEDV